MPRGKGWDMASLHSLDAAAEWLRKQADAVLVLVVRGEDVGCALDLGVAPRDAVTMVEVAMPEIAGRLEQARTDARCQAQIRAAKGGA